MRHKNIDEVVLEDVELFHLENMSSQHLWLSVHTKDKKIYHLNVFAKGNKLNYYWSDETPDTSQSVPQNPTDPDGVL